MYQSNFDSDMQFETAAARDAHDSKQALRLANSERAAFDDLSAEQIRSLYEQGLQTQEQRAAEIRSERAGEVFVQLHPEFVACKENAVQVESCLELMGVDKNHISVENIEAAYEHLRARGLVRIDEQRVKAQRSAEVAEEAGEIRRRRGSSSLPRRVSAVSSAANRQAYSEDDLYTLPLEKLRELALNADEE